MSDPKTMSEIPKLESPPSEPESSDAVQAAALSNSSPDLFAYLDRAEFSAEKFKIEIKNLPKYYGIQELRKLLNQTLELNSSKVKVPFKNSRYCFVCFHNDAEREKALDVIRATKWKGSQLNAIKAKPSADPFLKKRKADNEGEACKKTRIDIPVAQQLRNQTTPLSHLPYTQQVAQKQNEMRTIIRNLGEQLLGNSEISAWIAGQQAKFDGLPCELLEAKYVDIINGYRNKCEFTVGICPETGAKTVGFRIGSYVKGNTGVAPMDELQHVPDVMKKAAKLFEKYVRHSSLAVFDPIDQSGHFKQLTARTANGQLMLIVGIVPTQMELDAITALQRDLVEFFFSGDGKEAGVTSLYYQPLLKKKYHEDQSSRPILLHGEEFLHETLLGLQFRISPMAFFQVNTACAELLYETVIDLAGISASSTVVDVCCGTGTIGLCCARRCNQVLGVESVDEAVRDAGVNASLNNISNAEFFAGKAEDILSSVVARARNDDVIAILDPPRAGLHKQAIAALRKVDKINRMVFVACNPKKSCENIVDLARPASKTIQGVPFVPVKAVMVDMFPHTPHAELVLLLERLDTSKLDTIKS